MNTLLNETQHYEIATLAVDAVDAILSAESQIDGLQLDHNRGGFTFIGDDGAHILGIRNRLEDSVFEYILGSARLVGGGLSRATLRRNGYELFLRDQTEPLDESRVLQEIIHLGQLATGPN